MLGFERKRPFTRLERRKLQVARVWRSRKTL